MMIRRGRVILGVSCALWFFPVAARAVAPAPPTGLGAADVIGDQGAALKLSWAANTEADLKDYRIHRSTNGNVTVGSSWTVLMAVVVQPGTTHQDAGLNAGTTFFYRVTARNAALEESSASAEVSAYPVDDPPAAPQNAFAADVPSDQGFAVRITWTSNTEVDLKDYGIYRATFSGLLFTKSLRTRVAAPGTTHQDAGLSNGTPYYYQMTARDVNLNESGAAADFSAIPLDNLAPAAPVGLGLADPGTGVLNLSWAANTESDLKDYRVYRSTNPGVTLVSSHAVTAVMAPGTTHQDGGLTAGVTYRYRMVARDLSLNESGGSAEVTGTAGTPAAPGGLGVSDVPADGGTALNLSWTANTESDLKDYRVRRATFVGGATGAPVLATLAPPGTTHQDAGLTPVTTYYYALTARDTGGNESGGSSEVTLRPVDNVPGVPAGVVVADVPVDQGFALRLSWSPNSDTDLKDYGLFRATWPGAGPAPTATRIVAPGTTHQDAGLTNGTTYYFRLTARDASLNESGYSTEVSCWPTDNLAPSSPTAPGVSDVPADQGFALRMSWTGNTEPDLKDYRVYRATSSPVGISGVFSPAATIAAPGTTHQDGGLTNGATYYFRLTARDVGLNESGGSTEVSAFPSDNIAPSSPTVLGAADAGVDNGDRLNLSWVASSEADLRDYRVYRASWAGANLAPARLVATVSKPGTTHQDTGLNPFTTFYYVLTARDAGLNESGGSTESALKPTDELPPVAAGGLAAANPGIGRRIRLNWTANTEGDLKDYRVYRATFAGFAVTTGAAPSPTPVATVIQPGTTHEDAGLTDGTTYYFRLTARDLAPNESAGSLEVSASPTDTTAPSVPIGLTPAAPVQGRLITLAWTANTEEDLQEYRLYRATYSGAGTSPVPTRITAPGTTHQDAGLLDGVTYYYRIRAIDLTGNPGAPAAEVSRFPWDSQSPSAPALISVLPTSSGEGLNLVWTSNTETDLKDYGVYRATWAGAGPAPTRRMTFIAVPGTTHQDAGLTGGVTYYYQLTSRDVTGNESPGSAELSRVAGPDLVPPAVITSLAAAPASTDGFVRLTWVAVGGDGVFGIATGYQVRSATSPILSEADLAAAAVFPQTWAPQPSGSLEDRIVGPLVSGTTYYFAVKAYDQAQNSGTLSNASGNSAPAQNLPPGAPAISAGNLNWGIRLTLSPPADPDLRNFVLFSGPSQGGPYVQIATIAATAAIYDDVLTAIERRYYVVRIEDRTGYPGPFSSEATGKPAANLPAAPTDVKAEPGAAGTLISWRAPARYADGTPYGEKSGYRIERAASLASPWLTAAEAAADVTSWTDTTAGNFFYRIRALTGPKVPGPPSLAVSNQAVGATFAIGTDDQGRVAAVLEIGGDAVEDLRAASNGRGQDVFIEVLRKPELRTADVIEAFEFQPSLAGTGEKIAQFRFRRPVAMTFSYQLDGGQISRLGVPADQAAGALAVYTHNGIDWVNLGGEVDTGRREVKAKTSSLSLYRLARAARAAEFRLVQVVPPRTFTPNGDGVWDQVEFFYENPAGATVTGKILDAKGAQVADLKIGGRGTSLVWDGLDAEGRPAPGGAYLYQIEFGDKVIHGAIVLAR